MDEGRFDWSREFARVAPRIVDAGCGDGRFLIRSAQQHPERDHLGIEVLEPLLDKGRLEARRLGLPNLRFLHGDAVSWLAERCPASSLDELHVYHPQPYYDPTVVGLGMLSPAFLERAWQVLRPEGLLVLQTDSRPYGKYLLDAVRKHFEPRLQRGAWPDAPEGRTRREEVALLKKLGILRILARRRDTPLGLPDPPPYFEPGRPGLRTVRAASRRPRRGRS